MTSDKMFVTKAPALPSKCAVCYTQAKGQQDFIDFGASIDYYGAILICELCIVNAAKLVGFVSEADSLKAESDSTVAKAETIALRLKVQTLESLVASYVTDPDFDLNTLFNNVSDLPLEFEFSEPDAGLDDPIDDSSKESANA